MVDNTIYRASNGTVAVEFPAGGSFTAIAEKTNTSNIVYLQDSVEITVNRNSVSLNLTANQTDITAGETVEFTVIRQDNASPTNATLSIANTNLQTGSDGAVTYTFKQSGNYSPTVNKANTSTETFVSDNVTISVEKKTVNLTLSVNRSSLEVGDTVLFSLVRNDTGEFVSGSIQVNGTTLTTGTDGVVMYTFGLPGEFTATASKTDTPAATFTSDSLGLTVARKPVELNVTANQQRAAPGDTIQFNVTRADTNDPVPATVHAAGSTFQTGEDGLVGISFASGGNYTVVVSKSDTRRHTFINDSITVVITSQNESDDGSDNQTPGVVLTPRNASAAPGGNATVSFALTNKGDTTSFILNVSLPEDVSVVGQSPDGATWSPNQTSWLWRSIETNDTVAPSITVTVPENTTTLGFTINATARTSTAILGRTTARVTPVTLTTQNEPIGPDGNTTVQFDLTNLGPDSGLVVNLSIPDTVTIVNQDPDNGTWSPDLSSWVYQTVATGETVSPTVTVQVPTDATEPILITGKALTTDGVVARATAKIACQSLTAAVDTDDDRQIGNLEILNAIELWRSQTDVSGTCGQQIDNFEVLNLIELWRTQETID